MLFYYFPVKIIQLIKHIEKVVELSGKLSSWFSAILILTVVFDVVSRYFFNASRAWVMEFEWHLFALIFLFGAGFCFKRDQHVRVDLFYADFSKKNQALVNFVGGIFLLIPWCLFIIWTSFDYAMMSYLIDEKSPDPGGLPYRYLIKFSIVIGFFLLFLQAIISVFISGKYYFKNRVGE
jgi:TRAP-type mannitol/chloroaromatic compound transport system permease small subunit